MLANRDTLLRHLPIHDYKINGCRSSKPGNVRVSRACMQCAKVRLRCDGEAPCARCKSKGDNCAYPGRSRKRIPTIEELQQPAVKNGDERSNSSTEHIPPRRSPSQQSLSPPQITPNALNAENTLPLIDNPALLPPLIPYQPPLLSSEPLDASIFDTLQQSADEPPYMFSQRAPLLDSELPISDHQSIDVPLWNVNWAGESDFSVMDWITIDNNFLDSTQSGLSPYDVSPLFDSLRLPNDASLTNEAQVLQQCRIQPSQSLDQMSLGNSGMGFLGSGNTEDLAAESKPKLDLEREWPTNWYPTTADNLVYFPDMSKFPVDILEAESFGHVECLSPLVYHEISQSMKRNGLGQNSHFRPFQNANLPSIEALDCFVQLYFEYFHPVFPLLHKPSFDPSNSPWQLVLAAATIGFRYSKVHYAAVGSNALQELLRRSLAETVSQKPHYL
jgi:hypothetical protein